MSATASFKYDKLPSDGLRLLRPMATPNGRSLQFDILTFRRDGAPPYTAVSYTWGQDMPTEHVRINGAIFPVRTNLWSCLHYLSLHAQNSKWSYIWVDAICTNQMNDAERSQQVGIMDKIYKNAECVSVWIGLSPIPEVWSAIAAPLPGPIKTLDVEYLDWLDYISELANRPYWSRFWVIQEFLLGRDVEILCSNSRIHWSDFKDILSYCAGVELNGDVSQSDLLAARSTYAALPLITDRHPDRHPEFFQPLYDLLIQHRQSQCKDPRDRVFALLGLVNTDERRLLSRFFPNYNLSEEDVVIITLAHVTQLWNEHSVGLGSDDLFLGLGIADRKRRKGLMKAANSIDYIGCESINEYMTAKELWSDLQDLDSLDPDVYDGAAVTRRPRVRLTGLGMLISILAVSFGVTVWRYSR